MTDLTGLTKENCATGCGEQACVIGGRPRCLHPCKSGMPDELIGSAEVMAAYDEACTALGVANRHKPELHRDEATTSQEKAA